MPEEPRNPVEPPFPWSGPDGPASPPPAPPPVERPRPFWQRLIGVFVEPVTTMTEAGQRPAWVVPFVLILAAYLGYQLVLGPRLDQETMIRDMLEKRTQMTPAQIDEVVESQAGQGKIGIYLAPLTPAIGLLLAALVLWGISWLVSRQGRYVQHLSVVAHASLIMLLRWVATVALLLLRGDEKINPLDQGWLLPTNPGYFAGEDVGMTVKLLMSIPDIFTIWFLFLLIVGVAAAASMSRAKAALVVLIPWGILTVIGLAIASLFLSFNQ